MLSKEEIEKAKNIVKDFNDGFTFKECEVCFKFNEKDNCCNKEKCESLQAIETLLQYIDQLEQENKKQNKIIDEISFSLADYVLYYEYDKCRNPEMIKNKANEVKKYFEEKVEKE